MNRRSYDGPTMQAYQPNNELACELGELHTWQVQEIEAALREADAGDFADDKDVADFAGRWLA